jgi:hypothetical protein
MYKLDRVLGLWAHAIFRTWLQCFNSPWNPNWRVGSRLEAGVLVLELSFCFHNHLHIRSLGFLRMAYVSQQTAYPRYCPDYIGRDVTLHPTHLFVQRLVTASCRLVLQACTCSVLLIAGVLRPTWPWQKLQICKCFRSSLQTPAVRRK